MGAIAESDLSELQALVRRPTPENMVELLKKLESLADQVACIKAETLTRGACDPVLAANLGRLQAEMARTRRMLSSAATFYNGLASLRTASTTGYARTGLLRSAESAGRVLAQL